MYITINSMKKTLGKYIEMNDLYVGIPMLMIFLILFAFTPYKLISVVFFTTCVFLMIPINLSKKNRMYKVLGLFFTFILKKKNYYYIKEKEDDIYKVNKKKN